MLVLTRIEGESIVIGDPAHPIAVVSVRSVRGERVRIGVEAPVSIPVHRQEVADQIRAERAAASAPPLARLGQGEYARDIEG